MKKLAAGLAFAGVVAFNPIVGHAALGDQTLKPEMEHSDVQELQELLDEKGYFDYSKTTEYYGDYTTEAVKEFQNAKGLAADGITGKETYKALGIFSKEAIVNTAKKYEGTSYEWGGESPDGFDCSGYLQYIFDEGVGVELDRTVAQMYEDGKEVSSPAIGDIVFFDLDGNGPSHAGVYIGKDKFMHASSSEGVTESDLESSYWKDRYIGAKRYR
ncbi:C40 family peptidase [Alkalihalobacillus sp. TS-13]|uniref:C40 family peptidase n=1 Tax=Alkalihalobacillus sp. TS-13 TaxID=2842455 RepID=UPI001C8755B8|nr:NlpC/P60 family protein [Alkalihalobacillus sp. TS-13]